MWHLRSLKRIDFRILPLLILLMIISLLVISSTTCGSQDFEVESLFTPFVRNQLLWFGIGWAVFLFLSGFDYHKLQDFAWILYVGMLILLMGLFLSPAIQNVHRWYRIAGFTFQPSECAKLIVVLVLSRFLDQKSAQASHFTTAMQAMFIILVPFFLILKQPDLGTALVLLPITLVMFYFGRIKKQIVVVIASVCFIGLTFVGLIFLGVIPHETLRPVATKVIKDYQFDRLSPQSYHQKAAQTAIALGGATGSGWHKSDFTGRKWLPAAHTDSVFAAFAEEFGLLGVTILLGIFFALVYLSFQVTVCARDRFGRLLSAGVSVYLAVHVLMNLSMMSGFLPITGVPLILISYGGSSILSTMSALGVLQSIYSRRFTF